MTRVLMLVCCCALGTGSVGLAGEKIDCALLPSKVLEASKVYRTKAGTERACEKIQRAQVMYEVKVYSEAGRMQEIVFRQDGSVEEREEESRLNEIPAAARTAIEEAIPKSEFLKVDVLYRRGQTLYEGEYQHTGAKQKMLFDAKGHRVQP